MHTLVRKWKSSLSSVQKSISMTCTGSNYGYKRSNRVPLIFDYSGIGVDARRVRGI